MSTPKIVVFMKLLIFLAPQSIAISPINVVIPCSCLNYKEYALFHCIEVHFNGCLTNRLSNITYNRPLMLCVQDSHYRHVGRYDSSGGIAIAHYLDCVFSHVLMSTGWSANGSLGTSRRIEQAYGKWPTLAGEHVAAVDKSLSARGY